MSCGKALQFVQMSLGSSNTICCNPAVDDSVMIVAVREHIAVFGSVSASRPIFVMGAPSVLCCCLGAE